MLSLVLTLVRFAQAVMQYLAQRDLIDAGRAVQANEALNKTLMELEHARKIARKYDTLSDEQRLRLHTRYTRK